MSKIKGIYAAGMSVLNDDLSLNIEKTISHSEKIIEQGCHGVAIFGSTGQAQLIPVIEKINLLNKLSLSKYKNHFIVGTGLNSLIETINLMKIAISLNFKKSPELGPKPVQLSITLVQRYLGKPDQMHLMWNWVRSVTTEIN